LYQSKTSNKFQPPGRRLKQADFCPNCRVDVPHGMSACSERGLDIPLFLREKDCAGKTIVSLNHQVTKTSTRPASVWGNLREEHAEALRLAKLFSIHGYDPVCSWLIDWGNRPTVYREAPRR
jgi:hypothetical protein